MHRCGEQDLSTILPGGKNSFQFDVKTYNTMGYEVAPNSLDKKLIVIRMQVSDIMSPHDSSNLGSVVFCDTFF